MIHDYEKLVERITKASDKDREEIEKLVEAKRSKLSGLISREGAAQIVASEIGVNFEKERVKINEILTGSKKVNLVGKVIRQFPIHEFEKNGRKGKVLNLILADDSGNIKTVFWDTNHISMFEKGEIKDGDFIEISNASLRNNELHLSGFSDVKKSKETIENVKTTREFIYKPIKEFNIGGNFKTRAVVVQTFGPKFFEICPECNKKVTNNGEKYECGEHGEVLPQKRALINFVLDDGTENIRAVAFSDSLEKMGLNHEKLEDFEKSKEMLLGEEKIFAGQIKQNKMFNNPEMIVNDVEDIKIEELIENLEK